MGSGSSRRRGAAGRGAAAGNRELPGTAPAECEEAAGPPAPGRRAPAAGGIPPPRDGGGCGEAAAGGGGSPSEQAALSTRSPSAPENNNADHQYRLLHTHCRAPSHSPRLKGRYCPR
ncbi:cystin-1 isoform X2 [Larus michahellis]|uniref:cystin-1 isoform X2 n=1 Tax=Larus michahellis TaxID=119627 RepID=UPI003D9BD100